MFDGLQVKIHFLVWTTLSIHQNSARTQDIMDITSLSQTGVLQNTGYLCKGDVVHLDTCLSLTVLYNLTMPEKLQNVQYMRQILNDFSKNILF